MRILLLNYEFPPLGGGASHASWHIARTLVRRGHAVDVLTSGMSGQPAWETIEGVSVRRVRAWRHGVHEAGLVGAFSYLARAAPACGRMLGRTDGKPYDVVHCFFGLPTGALLLLVPELAGIPTVVSLRGSDVPGYDEASRMLRGLHRVLAPATRTIWSRASRLVANSEGLRALGRRFAPDQAIGMIHNGVSSDLFKAIPRTEDRDEKTVRLLCAARLVPRKGLSDLLHAMALVEDRELLLTIVGGGPEEGALRARAHLLGVAARVRFTGAIAHSEMPGAYSGADLFVLPSHTESCSMALLEAMSCGLPVIATDVGGTAELVVDSQGGLLVPPRSPAALAQALRRMAASPRLRTRMGAFNRARIEAQHGWDAVTDRYLEQYACAIHGRTP